MKKIAVPEEGLESLFGTYDENLKQLESVFGVRIRTQGNELTVEGDPSGVARAERTLAQLAGLMREGYRIGNGDVKTAAQLIAANEQVDLRDYLGKTASKAAGRRQVAPKSPNQRRYLEAIEQNDIVFGVGR